MVMGASRVQSTGKGVGRVGVLVSKQSTGVWCSSPVFKRPFLKSRQSVIDWRACMFDFLPWCCLSWACKVVQHKVCSVCLWASLSATQKPCTVTDLWRCRIPSLWVKFPSSPGLNNVCSQTMNRPLTGLFKRWSAQVFNSPYHALNVQLIACNFVYDNGRRPHGDVLWG